MERYTYFEDGKWRIRVGDTEHSGPWVDRLAAYENTGLEPEEIEAVLDKYGRGYTAKTAFMEELQAYRALGTVEELAALAKPKAEGLLVVLPCKDGDKIYNTASFFGRLKEPEEHLVEGFYLWRGDVTIICAGATKYGLNKLGKTVFLTRAEAEAAIGGGNQ